MNSSIAHTPWNKRKQEKAGTGEGSHGRMSLKYKKSKVGGKNNCYSFNKYFCLARLPIQCYAFPSG